MENFLRNLDYLIKSDKRSVREICRETDIHYETLRAIRNRRRIRGPTLETFIRLAKTFRIPAEVFITGNAQRYKEGQNEN